MTVKERDANRARVRAAIAAALATAEPPKQIDVAAAARAAPRLLQRVKEVFPGQRLERGHPVPEVDHLQVAGMLLVMSDNDESKALEKLANDHRTVELLGQQCATKRCMMIGKVPSGYRVAIAN